MKYYVRKITLSKFPKPPAKNYTLASIKADAVADVRTYQDKLSVWEINSDSRAAIDEAVLAIVTSSKQERFDDLDIVVFSDSDIATRGLSVESEKGDTVVVGLQDTHRNIVSLTYESLASILSIISDVTIKAGHVRIRNRDVEDLIKRNIDRINLNLFMNDNIKLKIEELARKID